MQMNIVHAQFVDGAFEGVGAETFPEGLYVGSFRNGQRHGLGKLLLPFGSLQGAALSSLLVTSSPVLHSQPAPT